MICQYCKSEWNMHEGTTCNTAQVLYMSFKMSSAGRDKWILQYVTVTLVLWRAGTLPQFLQNHSTVITGYFATTSQNLVYTDHLVPSK